MLMVDLFAHNLVKESLRFPPRFTEKNVMVTTLSPGIASLMSVVDPLVFLVWLDLPDSLVLMVPLDLKDSLDKMVPLANVDLKDPMDPKDPPEKLDLKETPVCKVFPDLKDRLDKLDPVVRLVNKVTKDLLELSVNLDLQDKLVESDPQDLVDLPETTVFPVTLVSSDLQDPSVSKVCPAKPDLVVFLDLKENLDLVANNLKLFSCLLLFKQVSSPLTYRKRPSSVTLFGKEIMNLIMTIMTK